MVAIRQPQMTMTAGVRHEAIGCVAVGPLLHRRSMPTQAAAGTGRSTGFSTIGRLMRAESTPNSTESHHTMS